MNRIGRVAIGQSDFIYQHHWFCPERWLFLKYFIMTCAIILARLTYLVFAKEWQVENDFQRLGIGSEHYKVGKTAVKGLSGLVSAFLQLYHVTKGELLAFAQPPSCHQ